jgi:hypothetical protein
MHLGCHARAGGNRERVFRAGPKERQANPARAVVERLDRAMTLPLPPPQEDPVSAPEGFGERGDRLLGEGLGKPLSGGWGRLERERMWPARPVEAERRQIELQARLWQAGEYGRDRGGCPLELRRDEIVTV